MAQQVIDNTAPDADSLFAGANKTNANVAELYARTGELSSIAALKALSVSGIVTGELRPVTGYYTAGDGGGGTFRYNSASSATDNGGTIIAPTTGSGRWERIYSGDLNAKWFGAVEGSDSAPAVMAALNAQNPYGTVVLPAVATFYPFLTDLSFPSNRTLLNHAEIRLGAEALINLNNPGAILQGGKIHCATGATEDDCVQIGKDNCWIKDVYFTGSTRTEVIVIYYNVAFPAETGTITGGGITGCTFNGTNYAVFKARPETTVNDFHVTDNTFLSLVGGDAIEWNTGKGVGLLISRNIIDGVAQGAFSNGGIGIGVAGNTYGEIESATHRVFSITDNIIRNVNTAIHSETCYSFLIANNHIDGVTAAGASEGVAINTLGCRKMDILGNKIGNAVYGIEVQPGWNGAYVQPPKDFTIKGNTVRDATAGYLIYQNSGADGDIAILRDNDAINCTTPYQFGSVFALDARNNGGWSDVSADNGNASVTLTMSSPKTQRFNTVLTANRTVTLPANANAYNGARFRVVRQASATGAFTIIVQDASASALHTFPSGTVSVWAEFEYTGSAWIKTTAGSL